MEGKPCGPQLKVIQEELKQAVDQTEYKEDLDLVEIVMMVVVVGVVVGMGEMALVKVESLS